MALKIDSEFHGINVTGAYCSIGNVGFGNDKTEVLFTLYRRSEKVAEPFTGDAFRSPYEINGANPFTQVYDYLKTLPEFAEAEDV